MADRRLNRRQWMAASVAAAAGISTAARAQAAAARHVVLISIDGFGAYNLTDPRLPIPNIRSIAAEGVQAGAMTVITPSVTWPDHTTLVTGLMPANHSVIANGRIERATTGPPFAINPRRTKEELTPATTLYDVAHRAGLTTADVNWPVTRGAPTLTWSIPDHPEPIRHTTPALLDLMKAKGLLTDGTDSEFDGMSGLMRDHIWTETACALTETHRPNLLLLHLLQTDSTQHQRGPGGTEALLALALADRLVGRVVETVGEGALRSSTALFVTSDHGFIKVERVIQPNVRLAARGLIRKGAGDLLEYDAQVISEGGVALLYVPLWRLKPELVQAAREALEGMEGIAALVDAAGFPELGLPQPQRNPQAPSLLLTAKDGYSFGSGIAGPEIIPQAQATGSHGYLHTNPLMDGILVGRGAGVRKGVRLERVRNTDVAPTLARLMGLTLPQTDGRVLEEFLL